MYIQTYNTTYPFSEFWTAGLLALASDAYS